MVRRSFSQPRGLKRHNKTWDSRKTGNAKTKRRSGDVKLEYSLSPSASDTSEEHSDPVPKDDNEEVEEQMVFQREPTTYDVLLKKLGSSTESMANALRRRQRDEEGKSDSEEDKSDDVSESHSVSEVEEDGSDNEDEAHSVKITSRSSDSLGIQNSIEGSETEDDSDTDDDYSDNRAENKDEYHDLIANNQSTEETSGRMSTFEKHISYKLSDEEVDILAKKKWNYKWEVPDFDMSNCKWRGTGECVLKTLDTIPGYGLHPQLFNHWLHKYKASGGSDFHSSKQRLFLSLCSSYRDILYHNKKPFYLKGREEDSSIMDAYIMHSLNHILRARDLIRKNESELAKQPEATREEILNSGRFLDSGFTRPKVLVLLPLASIALRFVNRLIELTPLKHKFSAPDIKRFREEFGVGEREDMKDEEIIQNPKSRNSTKPADFQALFGGNNNDHFMIGIKFTRASVKLYANFYSSDIIVASPLGLITKMGEAEVEKEKDVDYLSSIEVLIIDHADVIVMQNWSHVNTVVEQLNRIPSKQHGTNIMRIRPWYLDEQARFYRQTIVLSTHINPDINAMFNHHCLNYEGKLKSSCEYKGVLPKILLQVRQIYERFDAESIEKVDDARLEYFSEKVFPKIKDSFQGGVMLFVSSYFEFVRLRNFLRSQEASFCLLGEYTKQSDISRARVWFFHGQRKIMVYTERAHFYHRYKIRGIQNLIVYSLPERKEFYPEIVNMLEGSDNMTCTVLFSRFDQLRLERIVGSAPARRMATSEKSVFVFC